MRLHDDVLERSLGCGGRTGARTVRSLCSAWEKEVAQEGREEGPEPGKQVGGGGWVALGMGSWRVSLGV